jgi:two-component system LytT family response regulator
MKETVKAVLVDDENGSREVLRRLLQKYFPEIEIAGEATHAQQAYELIRTTAPQLVFLDIQMPRGDGFSLLRRFETVPFEVIFVTSYDQYAINAIRFNALDYLLKPVEIPELKTAVEKVFKRMEKKLSSEVLVINLLSNLNPGEPDKKIAVHAGEKVKLLHVRDIEYIEADRRYCHLFMANHENYTTARSLADFDDYLSQDNSFIRISKSFILNVKAIKEYSKGEPFIITLKNGKAFEIPRRKKPEILERLRSM